MPEEPAQKPATPSPASAAGPSADTDPTTPDAALGYEQARDELTEVVQRLEAGGLTLEESLALWERGEALARICQEWLDGARQRLATAMERDEDGQS